MLVICRLITRMSSITSGVSDYAFLVTRQVGSDSNNVLEDRIEVMFNEPVDIQQIVLETIFEESITVVYLLADGPDMTVTVGATCLMF